MLTAPAILAVSLPENPTLADNLQFQLTGLLVVVFTLGVLAILVSLIGKIFIARAKLQPAPATATSKVEKPDAVPGSESIPGPIFAAIAAAVSTALSDRRFVIHGVQAADPRQNLAWGAEGRRSIYASRKVR
jgi:Na+-transporting methylmalonyl-CoA/oxaloacetate decarboxylase gamma subunit